MAKKKLSPKERREQEKQAKLAKINNAKKEISEPKQIDEKIQAKEERMNKPKSERKSMAKAAGLKSTFIVDENKLLMTSFGRGNDAVPEKIIENREISNCNAEPSLEVNYSDEKDHEFDVTGRAHLKANVNDPLSAKNSSRNPGDDLIGARKKLEQLYFGRNFEDNIHIQMIYNILDIEKILSEHINNIIYTIDNVRRAEFTETDDFIGYMSTRNSFEQFEDPEKYSEHYHDNEKAINNVKSSRDKFYNFVENDRIGYFGSAFYKTGFDKKVKLKTEDTEAKKFEITKKGKEEIYYILCILGQVRQCLLHSLDNETNHAIYSMGNEIQGVCDILDKTYAERVNALNQDFLERSKNNLHIIFKAYLSRDKDEIVREYYDFTVRKYFKNIGFSIKKLREKFLEGSDLTSEKYDSVRSKMYGLIDFVVYDYYLSYPDKLNKNVETLRTCLSEEQKERFYNKESADLWTEIENIVLYGIEPNMNSESINNISKLSAEDISDDKIDKIDTNVDYFTKTIYLLTLFLDGKEINILLTALINKFENIASFNSVLEELNLPAKFSEDYRIFENSKKIAEELREVNSFARMGKPNPDAKSVMPVEASLLIGADYCEQDWNEYLLLERDKRNNGLMNFILYNVVESSRFRYLVRYANINKLRNIAENKKIVRFVLDEIPETQIDRYYYLCGCSGVKNYNDRNEKREIIADKLVTMNAAQFKESFTKTKKLTSAEIEDREHKRALISLYLTVLYIFTKNLVNINSRYTLAFHKFEHDYRIIKGQVYNNDRYNTDWLGLTEDSIEADKKEILGKVRTHRWAKILENNMNCSDQTAIRLFRNSVAHLNAVRNADEYIDEEISFNSYFELYHYLMQRSIMAAVRDRSELNVKTQEYFDNVEKRHHYSKDFTKAYCTPFGYNYPRYKNLTIDGLFDMNRPGEDED